MLRQLGNLWKKVVSTECETIDWFASVTKEPKNGYSHLQKQSLQRLKQALDNPNVMNAESIALAIKSAIELDKLYKKDFVLSKRLLCALGVNVPEPRKAVRVLLYIAIFLLIADIALRHKKEVAKATNVVGSMLTNSACSLWKKAPAALEQLSIKPANPDKPLAFRTF